MVLTEKAKQALDKVRAAEPDYFLALADTNSTELEKQLAALYHHTELLYTQQLIRLILTEPSTRKLNAHHQNPMPVQRSTLVMASLKDYLQVLACNSDYQNSIQELVS